MYACILAQAYNNRTFVQGEFPQGHLHSVSNSPALAVTGLGEGINAEFPLEARLRRCSKVTRAWPATKPCSSSPIPPEDPVKSRWFSSSFVKAKEGSERLYKSQTPSAPFLTRYNKLACPKEKSSFYVLSPQSMCGCPCTCRVCSSGMGCLGSFLLATGACSLSARDSPAWR